MDNNNQNTNTGAKGVFPGATGGPTNIVPQISQVTEGASNTSESKTFFNLELENEKGDIIGVMEIDLISFREKGVESRYLSINTVGAGEDGNQSSTLLSIGNETDFNKFKKFISGLNWND